MKNTIKILSLTLSAIMLLGMIAALSSCRSKVNEEETMEETTEEFTTEAITIEKPVSIELETITETTTEKTTKEHTTEKIVEYTTENKIEPTAVKYKKPETTTEKQIATTKKVVTTTKKEKVTEKITAYSCGCKNHYCTSSEEHSFLVSLEKKGCSICGSHSCPSFYALDEWGQQCYDIKKCPKYSEKKDPCIYCQYCGRKNGLGDNGTCVRFTVETVCPICNKTVKAKTCHTH